ncbi:serine/threonine-protein kinase [Streptomyces sp. NPDC002082]|uniref:serine/threonine-protein kinase n=1 Tax=Streptomyces sp. NPDC002082 TaxID=3154772 RepID=UPI00331950E5
MERVIQERYELLDLLGRGGMGEVWAAKDRQLDRSVAVKLLRSRNAGEDLTRLEQRFEREAQLTARMGHPGVPTVHETGRHEGDTLFIAMELVDGRTLSAQLKEHGPFSLALAATVAAQTADVLAHAHRIGVIHRDLKPSNLMLTGSGTVKVLDFGIAAAREPDPGQPRLTGTNEMPGTPGFISPEQGEGRPATSRSDLYALGCVLYEITTGQPPLTVPPGASPFVLILKHITDKPRPAAELRPELPDAFADLIMRLLAKDPAERPSTREVHAVAREWMTQLPPPAPSPPPRHVPIDDPGPRSPAPLAQQARRLMDQGEYTMAVDLLHQHLRRHPGDAPDIASLSLTLSEILLAGENFTRAYDGYFTLGSALRKSRPATDRDVLACRAGAARCLSELGRTPEALHEFEALLPVQQHVFGPMDRTVLDTRYEIAALTARGGQIQPARDQLTGLLADQQRVLPVGDERLTRTKGLLARLDQFLRST